MTGTSHVARGPRRSWTTVRRRSNAVQSHDVPGRRGDVLSGPVADVVEEIDRSGLTYAVNGASTVVEGDWERVMPAVHRAFSRLRAVNDRVYMVLTVDDHAGVPDRIHEAVEDIERELGHAVPH